MPREYRLNATAEAAADIRAECYDFDDDDRFDDDPGDEFGDDDEEDD